MIPSVNSVIVARTAGIKTRLTLVMLFCMGVALLVSFRAGYIQLVRNKRLEVMARRQFQGHALIRPRRGPILDRNGEPLAVSVEAHSLAANPSKINNKRQVARLLARSTDLPYARLFHRLSEKKEFVWIKRQISESELKKFKKWRLMDEDGDLINGLWLVKESDRVYPHGQLASHLLGDVNVDSEGLEGVEFWMNERLKGKVASVAAIKDALGRPTFMDAVAAKNVQDGDSVSLSLDASLQFAVEQNLKNAVQRTGSRSGIVLVMNARNGEILAITNEPTFDANEKGVRAERRRNRAVTDGYEPGSTLKAALLAAALSHGSKLTDLIWGERGSYMIQGHRISEAEAKEKFEWIDLKKMIQVSSNVAAAKLALKLGADRYSRTLRVLGLGAKTGLGFPGEMSGIVPPRRQWTPLTLANIGFGQGILVTPLQMARIYASFLNDGYLVRPTLFRKSEEDLKKESPVRVFSQKVCHDVIEALKTVVVEGGTGIKASLPGYQVAGKTGTAQMVDSHTGTYSKDKYISTFIGFPVGVEPKLVIFTQLVEPKGTYYASETTAPLFRDVLNSVANRFNMPMNTSNPVLAKRGMTEGAIKDRIKISQAAPAAPSPQLVSEGATSIMPSLKGLTPREAMAILRGHELRLEMTGNGLVQSHIPEAGKAIAEGASIRLILAEP